MSPDNTYEKYDNMTDLKDVIAVLGLRPLVGEGGMWSQVYVSDENVSAGEFTGRDTDRPVCATIHFLLTPDSFSCMHRLVTDEVWYHHCGPAAKLLLIHPDGTSETKLLGSDLLNGELPQICVPRGTWQGCVMNEAGPYTLMSTSMSPSYQDSDFTAGTYEELSRFVSPDELELLRKLTSEPVYG